MNGLESLSETEKLTAIRHYLRTDLYFLLLYGLQRRDVENQWILERCQEVQREPNGRLDLWSRDHYKSTIITYAQSLQDLLSSHGNDPHPKWNGIEITVAIFSCTRPIAKGFLRQIKREFEANVLLRSVFPDIIWENPHRDAPKWSEDDGIILKRRSNPKESTLEAWGIVDGQPTSKHFNLLVYDDVVTLSSVTSPDMINKVTHAWGLSTNLGSRGFCLKRYIGTRYHFNDTYRTIMERGAAIPRIHAATKDGTPSGEPVLLKQADLEQKRREMGPYIFSTQMLLNPIADENQGFREEWLQYHDGSDGSGMNRYIICDPASAKKRSSDYTVFVVIGLGEDGNFYTLDSIRDRLSLTERTTALFRLHRKWKPKRVGYEHYGMQADIEHIHYVQKQDNYRFEVVALGGSMPKNDRIKRLVPYFEQGKWYEPTTLYKTNYQKVTEELTTIFVEQEYKSFPVSVHDDMLDARSRILDADMAIIWPTLYEDEPVDRYARRRSYSNSGGAWSA